MLPHFVLFLVTYILFIWTFCSGVTRDKTLSQRSERFGRVVAGLATDGSVIVKNMLVMLPL